MSKVDYSFLMRILRYTPPVFGCFVGLVGEIDGVRYE